MPLGQGSTQLRFQFVNEKSLRIFCSKKERGGEKGRGKERRGKRRGRGE